MPKTKKISKKITSKKVTKEKSPKKKKDAGVKRSRNKFTKKEYIESKGGRKTARARVRIWPKISTNEIIINEKKLEEYFPNFEDQLKIKAPLELVGRLGKFKITVKVQGGGKRSQAEAVCLGVSRCLLEIDQSFRTLLSSHRFLTRDPRQKERKKFGLKKARKASQWQKR